MRTGFFLLIITGAILAVITFVLVKYAQGYRLVFDGKNLFTKEGVVVKPTGLLTATSTPDGASVYIDNQLTSATDSTIDLPPGEYTVRIVKEGYLPWEKKLRIQKEVVTQTKALLFPAAPKLESITSTGVLNPTPDPAGTSIAFGVASASAARKNGIYVLDMNNRPILTLRSSSLQIVDETFDSFSTASFTWSPNGQELLVKVAKSQATYQLRATQLNSNPQNITARLALTQAQWEKELEEKDKARLDSFKEPLADFIRKNLLVVSWSLDDTKVLYEASASAASDVVNVPLFLDPPLVGASSQPEEREIKKGRLYVYDTKEDKNFFIKEVDPKLPNPVWFPDNRHLIFAQDGQIKVVEYDGTNKTVIYAGPFEGNFVYPWPDGSRLVILASLNPQPGLAPNFYTINLK